jgi:hypothetical protein
VWLPILAAAATGCVATYGFGVGATADTEGNVGAQLTLRGGLGIALDPDWGLGESLRVDASPPGFGLPQVSPVIGIDSVTELDDDGIGIHVGLRGRAHLEFEGGFAGWVGPGLSLAVLPILDTDDDSDTYTHLGPEIEGYLLVPAEEDNPDPGDYRGFFSLSLLWERVVMPDPGDWGFTNL